MFEHFYQGSLDLDARRNPYGDLPSFGVSLVLFSALREMSDGH